ncbi:hypothetical protein DINM_000016 [Dirofilaria immitis]|nr:hypothetical protein [Dirofilaria immitis]
MLANMYAAVSVLLAAVTLSIMCVLRLTFTEGTLIRRTTCGMARNVVPVYLEASGVGCCGGWRVCVWPEIVVVGQWRAMFGGGGVDQWRWVSVGLDDHGMCVDILEGWFSVATISKTISSSLNRRGGGWEQVVCWQKRNPHCTYQRSSIDQ